MNTGLPRDLPRDYKFAYINCSATTVSIILTISLLLYVSVHLHSSKTRVQTSHNFLHMLSVAMVQSSTDDNVLHLGDIMFPNNGAYTNNYPVVKIVTELGCVGELCIIMA